MSETSHAEAVSAKVDEFLNLSQQAKDPPKSVIERWFWLIVFVALFIVPIINNGVLVALAAYREYIPLIASTNILTMSDVKIVGRTDLCIGDTLDFDFAIDIKKPGTYEMWMTTWQKVGGRASIAFSEMQVFVAGQPRNIVIHRRWLIPPNYEDRFDGVIKPFLPGDYVREISVISQNRNVSLQPLMIEFTIRDDCEEP